MQIETGTDPADTPSTDNHLFISKRVDRIHACRLPCGMVAKEATDRPGESHGEDKAFDAYDGRPPSELGDYRTKKDSHYCPQDAS
jgi:hypothetical protein